MRALHSCPLQVLGAWPVWLRALHSCPLQVLGAWPVWLWEVRGGLAWAGGVLVICRDFVGPRCLIDVQAHWKPSRHAAQRLAGACIHRDRHHRGCVCPHHVAAGCPGSGHNPDGTKTLLLSGDGCSLPLPLRTLTHTHTHTHAHTQHMHCQAVLLRPYCPTPSPCSPSRGRAPMPRARPWWHP